LLSLTVATIVAVALFAMTVTVVARGWRLKP
jgi:hypothetical protein